MTKLTFLKLLDRQTWRHFFRLKLGKQTIHGSDDGSDDDAARLTREEWDLVKSVGMFDSESESDAEDEYPNEREICMAEGSGFLVSELGALL